MTTIKIYVIIKNGFMIKSKYSTKDGRQMRFISPTYGVCETTEDVLNKIIERISKKPEAEWIVAIGSDSQNKKGFTKFCNAILVLEKGKGGTYFYSVHSTNRVKVLQARMLQEAEMSINTGREMLTILENKFVNEEFDFTEYNLNLEIHCDLGNNGKSKDSIKAAIGWITSEFGDLVTTRIKPDSPAASYIADRYTK